MGGSEDELDVVGIQREKRSRESETGRVYATWMAVNDFMETRLIGLSDYFRVGTGAPPRFIIPHTVDYKLVLESYSSRITDSVRGRRLRTRGAMAGMGGAFVKTLRFTRMRN